jgi:plasmid stabilization system protein ParE
LKRARLSPSAVDDLEDIALYLGTPECFDNPALARATVSQLRAKCRSLGQFPKAHKRTPEYGAGVRRAVCKRYIILFRETEVEVRIERILHGARDIAALMQGS